MGGAVNHSAHCPRHQRKMTERARHGHGSFVLATTRLRRDAGQRRATRRCHDAGLEVTQRVPR